MSDVTDIGASIDEIHRMLNEAATPELARQKSRLEQLVAQARRAREGIREQLDESFRNLEPTIELADESIATLEARFGQVAQQVEPWAAESKATTEVLLAVSTQHIGEGVARFQALSESLRTGDDSSIGAATGSETGLTELLDELGRMVEALAGGVESLEGEIEGSSNTVTDKLGELEKRLQELEQSCGDAFKALGDRADEQSRETSDGIRKTLQEATSAVGKLKDDTTQVLDKVDQLAEALGDVFGSGTDDILGNVKQLLDIVEQIRPLLDAVEQWT